MKIMFLDVDGVFTSARIGYFNFDIYAVNFIIWFCKQTEFKIVISSTWRGSHGKEFWDTIFPGLVHEDWKTKKFWGERRGYEVNEWLKRHSDTTDYLVIDDDHDFYDDQKEHCIFTDPENGFMFYHQYTMTEKYELNLGAYDDIMVPLYIHQNMFAVNSNVAKRVVEERLKDKE